MCLDNWLECPNSGFFLLVKNIYIYIINPEKSPSFFSLINWQTFFILCWLLCKFMIISWNGFSVTFNILNFSIISIFVLYLFFEWVCCHIYWVMVGNPRHCADYIPTHWTFFVFIWGRAKPSKSSTGWAKNHHAFTQKQLRPTRRHINVIIQPAIPMPHKTPQLTNLCIIRWKRGF